MFSNIKITLHYSVYTCTSGEKVRISDEAERGQTVSYPHTRTLLGIYTILLSLMPIEETGETCDCLNFDVCLCIQIKKM